MDRHETRHGIYPSFPAPTGVPWSEYLRSQRNRSRSVSSSTEALDSDHGKYITSQIAQHARSITTGTRSLPTDSPIPYFQPIERGHLSEGVPSDTGSLGNVPHGGEQTPPHHTHMDEISHIPSGGMEYHPVATEPDRLSTYTGLDDYDTLFEARYGMGALDNMPKSSGEAIVTSSTGMTPASLSAGMTGDPTVRIRPIPDSGLPPIGRKEHLSAGVEPSMMGHKVVSPVCTGHIIGEGAAIFTDMTETMLTSLDQQMASMS